MKAPVIILGVLCLILGGALYKRNESAGAEIEKLIKDQQSLSNQVEQLNTRLALANGTASVTTSNLQHSLASRTGDLIVLSNRLVQTHLLLQNAQREFRAAQEQLQGRIARVAVLEAELDEARRAASAASPALATREREALRNQVEDALQERNALKAQLGAVQVEKADLNARLLDREFLERQLKEAREAAEIRRRMASARGGTASDPGMKLELQPDGTVRYIAPQPQPQP